MFEILSSYWPHILAILSVTMGTVAAIHAAMTKREVRSALGWVGVIVLSPLLGALIYAIAGVNRIRRKSLISRRSLHLDELWRTLSHYEVSRDEVEAQFGNRMAGLKILGDRVAKHALSSGNRIDLLGSGTEAYAAFCAAIDAAERSIILETYIFDRDAAGERVADCLIAARKRGVTVRVLVDAVGARYSVPSILGYLANGGVTVAAFNGKVVAGLRLPYANLRTHRKILVVDGTMAFLGGMNIRAAFEGDAAARDTHFRLSGPAVADIFAVAAEDWHFEMGEILNGEVWNIAPFSAESGTPSFVRTVVSGPDSNLETNHKILMGAFSVAERSIRIMSPYFLPDNILLGALATAARRGVTVDVVVPARNNLAIVGHAMAAQFDQVVRDGSRIFRAQGRFDHSKLITVDGRWAFVGSSNLDSRSLRLNFEIDMEVFDTDFAAMIDRRIDGALEGAEAVSLKELSQRPFVFRLFNRILWLGSPYL
ncbi:MULTISPECIES: phospholipase D-like domain-containing protein [Alphaproteobacteria]|uniref:Phospholipase D n=2 Tax=Alphaproteobacteria TaxID=28211 RepID=A0A512HEB0_9HYPH|nr:MULTISPECIES: phospholipase D-like domain-containing protein [Alphaproteobacteria]GEO83782.1 cardiolipin synthetase [Ciceribacter naphthalenivorans]GLR21340.1 cardiolipin synthetase [Ciceribacter naphthalenivorans]GLT04196.1 cardiolipin synthetase [Sphingomonas psychrolutea]